MMTAAAAGYQATGAYPADFQVEPPAPQSRLTVFFRIILAIPHLIILGALNYVVGVTALIAWVAILVTGKCPDGLWKFHAGYLRWYGRAYAYIELLNDRYPPFSLDDDPNYPARFIVEPQLEARNRLTVFLRLILVIPHGIALAVLGIVASILLLIGWIVALVTGSVPAGIHNFLAGVLRWTMRVLAYAYLLRDEYPPFSLS